MVKHCKNGRQNLDVTGYLLWRWAVLRQNHQLQVGFIVFHGSLKGAFRYNLVIQLRTAGGAGLS